MSAGTLTLTNNSAAVSGSGTAFTTELAAGDFIVVTVGGIPYTLPVKTINSNASLTLVSNFTGPTQSGAAWYAVPRIAMNLVTAAAVTQAAEALRVLNYDKQNWQSIFSATGDITIRLPDGSTFTGPSWKYLSDNAATKKNGAVPVSQGGTGRGDGTAVFRTFSTDGTLSDGLMMKAPGEGSAYVSHLNQSGIVKWRHGYTSSADEFNFYSYDDAGNYNTNPLKLEKTGNVTVRNTLVAVALQANTSAYPRLELLSTGRTGATDVGAKVAFQIPSAASTRAYFVQSNLDSSQTGQILNNLPSSGGVLAVQGTSGRYYKKDIHPADTSEAMMRVLALDFVNFVYKDDVQKRQRFGIIAEDAEKIAPQYIKHNQEPIQGTEVFDDEGNKTGEEYRDRPSIDNNPIVMDLLGCIQNLQAQITELKDSMAALQK